MSRGEKMGLIRSVVVDPLKTTWVTARHDSVLYALVTLPVNLERGIRRGVKETYYNIRGKVGGR